MKIQQHDGVVVDAVESRQSFAELLREGEGKRKGSRAPSPLSNLDSLGGATLRAPLSFSPKAHEGPLLARGVPVTPRYFDKFPKHSRIIPMSEYHLPIYQSLPLDHFETPLHVRDPIPEGPMG